MSNIGRINSIPFEQILSKLWIKYKLKWDVIQVIENWRMTDWWRWSMNWGFLKCHSWIKPWRIEWDRLNLVKMAFWLNDAEAFKWYEENFNIDNKSTMKKDDWISNQWNLLPGLKQSQIEYLDSRWIWLNCWAKNKDWYIALPIRTEWWNIVWIQSRAADDVDKKNRYRIEWIWTWLFLEWYKPEKKELYVVEWMSDTMMATSLWLNVIWVVSAGTNISLLRPFSKKHKMIIIPDSDDAGNKMIENARDDWMNFGVYHISDFAEDCKDFCDLINMLRWISWWDADIEDIILSSAEMPLSNLEAALKKARKLKDAWTILIWDDVFDLMTAWIWLWKTMLINWPSWQGKTTLSLHILRKLLKKWIKVFYYSLETDVWTQLCQVLAFMNWTSTENVLWNIDFYSKKISELWGLELYDNLRTFNEITAHISEYKPQVAIIDFAQKCWIEWANEKEKMINYAQRIQNFAIDNADTSIISLSQTSMSNYLTPILQRTPKDSWALFESSDTTINVWKDENWRWVVAFLKTKNIWAKWWYKVCETNYDMSTWEYIIFPHEEVTAQPKRSVKF